MQRDETHSPPLMRRAGVTLSDEHMGRMQKGAASGNCTSPSIAQQRRDVETEKEPGLTLVSHPYDHVTLQVPIISMPNCLSAFHALLCYHSLPLNRGAMPLSSGGSYLPVVIIKCRCFGQARPQEDQDCTNRQTKALDWRDYQVIRKGLGPGDFPNPGIEPM